MTDTSVSARGGLLRLPIWLAVALAALTMLGPLGRFVDTSSAWLDFPYPRPGSEGLILYESLLVKRGETVYGPITPERFISGPYPPVYYYLAASVLPGTLPTWGDPNAVISVFRPGRLIALVSTLLAAALVALLVLFEGGYAAGGRRLIAASAAGGLIGGALLLTLPQVTVWATRFRGDMLMIALTAGGLLCTAVGAAPGRGHISWRSPALVLAALLFSLAFFTKQTALAGPAAAAAYLILRSPRDGLKWCLLMFGAVALPFALLDLATGHWFYLKMVVYHSLPLSQLTLTRLLHFALWDDQWPLLLAALPYTLYRLAQAAAALRERSRGGLPLLVPLFVLASLLTLPTGAVVGADHNHLLMTGLAVCAGVGALFAHLLTGAGGRRSLTLIGAAVASVALLLGYVFFTSQPSPVGYGPDLRIPSAEEQEQLRRIVLYVSRTEGNPFFSDDPGMVALAGKETPYDDPFTMATLATQGRWDEGAFREMLREGRFARLVLSCDVPSTLAQQGEGTPGVARPCRADTFTPGVLEAIRDGYEIVFRDVFFTYAPRARTP